MEVTLSHLLGHPVSGPVTFGTEMPEPSPEILEKIRSSESKIQLLHQLNIGEKGTLDGMLMRDSEKETLTDLGLKLGIEIERSESGYMFSDGSELVCSPELSTKLLIRV